MKYNPYNKLYIICWMLLIKLLHLFAISIKYIGIAFLILAVRQLIITGEASNIIGIIYFMVVTFSKEILYVPLNDLTIVNRFTGNVQMSLYIGYAEKLKDIKHRKAEYFTNRFIEGFMCLPDKAKNDLLLRHRNKYWATTNSGIFYILKKHIPLEQLDYKIIGKRIVVSKFLINKLSAVSNHTSFSYLTRRNNTYKITVDISTIENYRRNSY